jgi:hypothetical protein
MPGPLPDPSRRRTNASVIPTVDLPRGGLAALGAKAPPLPKGMGRKASAWWRWAWKTPQAVGWGVGAGMEQLVERRARLEDRQTTDISTRDELALQRQMLDIDDRLGLTPKGMAALRWRIVADPEPAGAAGTQQGVTDLTEERDRRARIAAG